MKNILILLLSLICFVAISSCSSQKEAAHRMKEFESEMFFAEKEVHYIYDSSKAEMVLYLEIPIENLLYQINYRNNLYESKVTISVDITGDNDSEIVRKSYDEYSAFTEAEIKEKIKKSLFYVYKYYLGPGKHTLNIKVRDENSENEYTKTYTFQVRDFTAKSITAGDLLLLKDYVEKPDGTKEITPLIRNNISGMKNLYVFFEIYNNSQSDSEKQFILKVSDSTGKYTFADTLTYNLKIGKNRKIEKLNFQGIGIPPNDKENQFSQHQFNNPGMYIKIELLDKISNEILSEKKLSLMPERSAPEMHKPPRQ